MGQMEEMDCASTVGGPFTPGLDCASTARPGLGGRARWDRDRDRALARAACRRCDNSARDNLPLERPAFRLPSAAMTALICSRDGLSFILLSLRVYLSQEA